MVLPRPFCPSVCLSNPYIVDKTKETCAHILMPYEKSFFFNKKIGRLISERFRDRDDLIYKALYKFSCLLCFTGRPLVLEILGQTDPVQSKMAIFNRYSLVAPQP